MVDGILNLSSDFENVDKSVTGLPKIVKKFTTKILTGFKLGLNLGNVGAMFRKYYRQATFIFLSNSMIPDAKEGVRKLPLVARPPERILAHFDQATSISDF